MRVKEYETLYRLGRQLQHITVTNRVIPKTFQSIGNQLLCLDDGAVRHGPQQHTPLTSKDGLRPAG